jgi:GNAT superfamily N-acetyltransferase
MQLRPANANDIEQLWEIRYAVRENTLTPGRISDEELLHSITEGGRGWVIEHEGRLLGFAIGLFSGHVWALFVRPEAEGQGVGSRLHAAMLEWYATLPCDRLWLTTDADSRARVFYEARGWRPVGACGKGELRLERNNRP